MDPPGTRRSPPRLPPDRATAGLALITGASSGIGAAYADRLAARGHGLIIVARDGTRLAALADRLGEAYGAAVETIVADLTQSEALGDVERRLRTDPAIAMLVNNAGIATAGRSSPPIRTR